jgi:hypothetical protein
MDPMTKDFVKAIERFVDEEGVDLVTFEKGQRKDDIAQAYLADFEGDGQSSLVPARLEDVGALDMSNSLNRSMVKRSNS